MCVTCWIWKKKNRFSLNSDNLQKQWLFKLAIIFPLVSSLYFIICLSAPYSFRFDSHGYNTFLEINKFSLSILALSPILGVFVVYVHRSIQSEEQRKISEKQLSESQNKNKADMYYSKRKFISEQLDYVNEGFNYKLRNVNELYNLAFLVGDNFNDEINAKFYIYLNDTIKLIISDIEKINVFTQELKSTNIAYDKIIDKISDCITGILRSVNALETQLLIEPKSMNEFKTIRTSINTKYSYYSLTEKNEADKNKFISNVLYVIDDIYIEINSAHQLILRILSCLISKKDIIKYMPNYLNLEEIIYNHLYEQKI